MHVPHVSALVTHASLRVSSRAAEMAAVCHFLSAIPGSSRRIVSSNLFEFAALRHCRPIPARDAARVAKARPWECLEQAIRFKVTSSLAQVRAAGNISCSEELTVQHDTWQALKRLTLGDGAESCPVEVRDGGKTGGGRGLYAIQPIEKGHVFLTVHKDQSPPVLSISDKIFPVQIPYPALQPPHHPSFQQMITGDSLPPPLASLLPPSFSVWARIALFLLLHHSPSASSSPSPSLSASPSPDQSVQSPALGSVSSLSTAPATATRPSSPPPATALPLPNHHHHHQHERWQPYISSLPSFKAVDSTVWWGELERSMLLPSLYNDTCDRTALIQSEFATIQTTLTDHPHLRSFLPNLTYDQFCHAYLLVCSRAWGIEALGNLALVPYADMINHNPHTHTLLCYDEEQQAVEIIADRDYEPGEQVLVSYGNLSSGVLALDFGFTVPDNPHDSVELCVLTTSSSTPHDAQLNEAKRRLLVEAQLLPCDSASGACFVLK
ncbi:unnamed protein product [Closterium sp. NIES-53]